MKGKANAAKSGGFFLLALLIIGASAYAAAEVTKYAVHDMSRPRPAVVTPADEPGQPPADAIVLFDGTDLSHWQKGNGADANWMIVDNDYMVVPKKAGGIQTRKSFGSCQLHVEWKTPEGMPPEMKGQKRSNSGVFLMGRYEVQVLDSYTDDNYQTNATYADGQAGALYGQHPPMVNVCRPAGQWQSYDIAFMRPLFDDNGKCIRKARVTILHNGVCIHNNLEIEGTTFHKRKAAYSPHKEGPISLQDHGNPMCFRNIWIRPLPEEPYLIK
jgi:3-keto-disaccharide hydrolase